MFLRTKLPSNTISAVEFCLSFMRSTAVNVVLENEKCPKLSPPEPHAATQIKNPL